MRQVMFIFVNKVIRITYYLSILPWGKGDIGTSHSFVCPTQPLRNFLPRTDHPYSAPLQSQAPKVAMGVEAVEVLSTINDVALTVATTGSDFGGFAGPIAGLGFIAGLIVILSPPLEDDN
jgi:hypothetical protein